MEVQTQIQTLKEFIEKNYYQELITRARSGTKSLSIDFKLLAKFSPELADLLLDDPENVLKAGEIAVEQFDLPEDTGKRFVLRVSNLSPTQRVLIRNIRSANLGKLLWFEGVVRQKSDVRPQVTSARFECPSCANIIPILQLDKQFKEPEKCHSCGRRGKFKLLSKELIDAQHLKLEEMADDIDGGDQPKRMNIFLKNDLVSPMQEKVTSPGSSIRITGIVKEIPIITKTGTKSTVFDLMIEANHIQPLREDYTDIKITKKDIEEIKKHSKDPEILLKLTKSIAPSIYGHDMIKEALLIQLMGGVRKVRKDGVTTRGDIHILLIGDPGSGKSQLIRRIFTLAPKARYVTGKGASGAGLTAAVVKDEILQDWALEAGALVLANKGVCVIDELDKMTKEDANAMHEAMEQQTITISKANIQATLRSETTILAAANPKLGRFDPFSPIFEQISLPVTLINRFDLIFPVQDKPDEKKDDQLSSFVLALHQNQNVEDGVITSDLLRKYIAYVRQYVKPTLTDSAIDIIKKYYLKMRSSSGGSKSVPITARQLEGLVRLAEAYARVRLAEKITKTDAQKAVDLMHYCLKIIAFDEETGTFDIDRIATDTPSGQRNKILIIKEIINDLEAKLGKNIPFEEIAQIAKEKGVEEEDLNEIMHKLKISGDIFEPKRGFYQKI